MRIYRKYKKPEYKSALSDGETALLGSRFAKFFLELTINPPRRKCAYAQLTSDQQMRFISMVMHNVLGCKYEMVNYCYETSADGNLHYHALIHCKVSDIHFPLTEVADVAKTVIFGVCPKKYALYVPERMCSTYQRYLSPCVCVQYQPEDSLHVGKFNDYIDKYKRDNKDIIKSKTNISGKYIEYEETDESGSEEEKAAGETPRLSPEQ